jgi:hypothetical protein
MVSWRTCETVGTSKEEVERTPLPATGREVPSAMRTKIGGSEEDREDRCVAWGVI